MKRFALAALAVAALALGTAEGRAAAAQPGGYRPAPEPVEVQYRPYYRSDRPYYYRQERRADRDRADRWPDRCRARSAN